MQFVIASYLPFLSVQLPKSVKEEPSKDLTTLVPYLSTQADC